MLRKQEKDLFWSQEGDFSLDTTKKDLLDTQDLHYRSVVQKILTRIMSRRGEWRLSPQLGANIADFVGKPNTRETADEIKASIAYTLEVDGFLTGSEYVIDIMPTSNTSIFIVIHVRPSGSRAAIQLLFSYSLTENRLMSHNG